jgi:hypothetical protein
MSRKRKCEYFIKEIPYHLLPESAKLKHKEWKNIEVVKRQKLETEKLPVYEVIEEVDLSEILDDPENSKTIVENETPILIEVVSNQNEFEKQQISNEKSNNTVNLSLTIDKEFAVHKLVDLLLDQKMSYVQIMKVAKMFNEIVGK